MGNLTLTDLKELLNSLDTETLENTVHLVIKNGFNMHHYDCVIKSVKVLNSRVFIDCQFPKAV